MPSVRFNCFCCLCFVVGLIRMRIHSPAATKDDHEGVGRGRERARQGAQDEPHKRSVYTKFNLSTFFADVGFFRYLVGRILGQGLRYTQIDRFVPGVLPVAVCERTVLVSFALLRSHYHPFLFLFPFPLFLFSWCPALHMRRSSYCCRY